MEQQSITEPYFRSRKEQTILAIFEIRSVDPDRDDANAPARCQHCFILPLYGSTIQKISSVPQTEMGRQSITELY